MITEPPQRLSDVAKDVWREVAPGLVERGWLDEHQQSVLELYCVAKATALDCARILKEQGMVFTNPNGGAPKMHPCVRAQAVALDAARRYAAELGLSQVGRHRAKHGVNHAGGGRAKDEDDDGAPPGMAF